MKRTLDTTLQKLKAEYMAKGLLDASAFVGSVWVSTEDTARFRGYVAVSGRTLLLFRGLLPLGEYELLANLDLGQCQFLKTRMTPLLRTRSVRLKYGKRRYAFSGRKISEALAHDIRSQCVQ